MSSRRLKQLGRRLAGKLASRRRPSGSQSASDAAPPQGQGASFPGASETGLDGYPPAERWDDWTEWDSRSWPNEVAKSYALVPTICFNCESACGLLAYIDKETLSVRKLEGNPVHPGSRGRNCAKGPATHNQLNDPDRILYPMKRAGKRGEGKWRRVSWDEALDDIAGRIRADLERTGGKGVVYHVGRPGEDGFTNRILQAWGVDGHNSHTNICSSNARAGYAFWMGYDRPSPDFAQADFILMLSAHLESGHYFNPHAQRIVEAKARGAKVAAMDPRLSNTAGNADIWLPGYPGTEAAVLLAIANYLIEQRAYDREFVRRWTNWERYLADEHPQLDVSFETFEGVLAELYRSYTFEYAARESGIPQHRIEQVARLVARAGKRFASYNWRAAAAGNEGGWQVARCLMLLHALTGSIGTQGGFWPNAWHKFVPDYPLPPPAQKWWQELHFPGEYPLSFFELSYLLPHFVKEGRGSLDVYFTRVYNPVWTNPDGFSWIEMLEDEEKVGCHVALTPTWSETAYLADYVLPMGHSSERHDLMSQETHGSQWLGFRQPVARAHFERLGRPFRDTRDVNPGEVWEENEFWLELTWRIDESGSLGIRRYVEKPDEPGAKMTVDDFYGHVFDHGVPGLPEAAAKEGLTPLAYMRRYGAFEVTNAPKASFLDVVPDEELADVRIRSGVAYSRSASGGDAPRCEPDEDGRTPVGVMVDGTVYRGWPTPSGRLEFYSTTLRDWGWPEYALPTYIKSHVHRDKLLDGETLLLPNFRLPVQIHTRSANAKWLDEIAHTNPLWLHPSKARQLGVDTGELVRVTTRIGYFVLKVWLTEAIRPDIVACSHHFGRWRLDAEAGGNRTLSNVVTLKRKAGSWRVARASGVTPFESDDPDTGRIWWSDVGVHQNAAFEVHPDPVSGMHCWHQAVRVERAHAGDRQGDIYVDTDKAHESYRQWLAKARSARVYSPNGLRRPYWLLRPLRPTREAYRLPGEARPPGTAVEDD